MNIIFVAAMSENHVIGYRGSLPWHLPDDLKHFKELTLGKNILMGRKTFNSIKKALPLRNNFVLTKNQSFSAKNITVFHSKEAVIKSTLSELWVIGGEEIYSLFLPECNKIYLTLVHTNIKGDTFFPMFTNFKEIKRSFHKADANHKFSFSFIEYIKLTPSNIQ